MSFLKSVIITGFLVGVSSLAFLFPNGQYKELVIESPENKSAVVVELFTSQGCSSCPAADAVLSKIIDQANAEDIPVFGLSFHVDYWNRLGWKDPYSQRAFTQRQYEYARKMKSSSVYTPQMIINGKVEFVGSRERLAFDNVKAALKEAQKLELSIQKISVSNNKLSVSYTSKAENEQLILNMAIVERGLNDNVTRGENRGRLLKHDNVVRAFQSQKLVQKGTFDFQIPKMMNRSKSSVIMFLQDPYTMEIQAATMAGFAQ